MAHYFRFSPLRSYPFRFSALVLTCGLIAAPADADTVTFNRDTVGNKPIGFTSVESNLLSFWDATRNPVSQLVVETPFGEGNGTNALSNFGNSILLMRFATPVSAFSMTFGNDDPKGTAPGDEAVLNLFLDGALVNTVRLVLNRDDLMNQTIASASTFDEATFDFVNHTTRGSIPFLAEVVDNISFTPTPEPATLVLFGGGLSLWPVARRRCRRR